WRHAVARRNYPTLSARVRPSHGKCPLGDENRERRTFCLRHPYPARDVSQPVRNGGAGSGGKTGGARFGEESGKSAGGLRTTRTGSASAQGRARRDDRQDGRLLGGDVRVSSKKNPGERRGRLPASAPGGRGGALQAEFHHNELEFRLL